MTVVDLEVASIGVGGGVVGWLAHWAWVRSRSRGGRQAARPTDFTARGPPPAAPEPAPGAPSAPLAPPAGSSLTLGAGIARAILLHLLAQGPSAPEEVARLSFTQAGIAEALGIRQGNASRVLGRLVAAGALRVDRGHVSGVDYRRKVYRLTALGESIARELRRRSP